MKHYNSYMDRQEISRETHERLLGLTAQRRPARPWGRYGALAACAALIVGVGVWKFSPASMPGPDPAQSSTGQFAAGYTPLPGQTDTVGPEDHLILADGSQADDAETGFVVSSPTEGGKLMFPMIPAIQYPEVDIVAADAQRIYIPGAFTADLTKKDIQTIFWGPEGKPEAVHPKLEQGDLPWALFWDGYTVRGSALYDGQGRLVDLTISGEQGPAGFTLALCPGEMPFTCGVYWLQDEPSEFNGVSISGWSASNLYDSDGETYVHTRCGSEFMTADNIGVRFENRDSLMRSEYGGDEDMALGGTKTFNALFVRQAITGGLYLDHLMTTENIPAWRDAQFSTLAQARQEADFAPYLPTQAPENYRGAEFHSSLSYQEGVQNYMSACWYRGYDSVEVRVHRDGYYSYDLADPARPETYDLRLYPIPWSESVPLEYRDTVDHPAFRAEDMSLAIVEARGAGKDTGGLCFRFEVVHPDGTVVSYRCDGMTAQQVWELVEETLHNS